MRNALGFLRMSSFVDLSASDDESASGVSSHSSDGCRSVRTLRKRHVRALLGLREDVGRGSVQLSDHSPTRRERGSVSGSRREEASSDESGSHGRDASPAAPRQLRGDDRPDESELPADLPDGLVESNKRTAPSASTPAVCFSPTRSVGRGRTAGPKRRKPASQQNASSSSSSPSVVRDGALAENFMQTVVSTSTSSPSAVLDSTLRILATSTSDLSTLISQVSRNYRGCSSTYARMADTYLEEVSASLERAATSGIDAPTSMLGQTSTDSCLSLIRAGQSLSLAVGCLARMVAPLNSDI